MYTCVDILEMIEFYCDYCSYKGEYYNKCHYCSKITLFAIYQIYNNNF